MLSRPTLALTAALLAAPARADFLAVTFDGVALRIDAKTGAATTIGSLGIQPVNALMIDRVGRMITQNVQGTTRYYLIDRALGMARFINPSGLDGIIGLASTPNSVAYAVTLSGGQTRFYRLVIGTTPGNPITSLLIGTPTIPSIVALAMSPDGVLYGWSAGLGLVTIDPLTAVCTAVSSAPSSADIQTIAFGPDGTLFGARDALFLIDRTTGVPTPIASGTFTDVRGMDWFDFEQPFNYCLSKANSRGCRASMSATGTASVTRGNDFHVTAVDVLNNHTGWLLWSKAPAQTAFFGGFLCLEQPFVRTRAFQSGGVPFPVNCSGSFDFHFSLTYMGLHALTAGESIYAQFFYRDPDHVDGTGVGLTDALRFETLP